jgi:hypothetical protein|tara:strand:+ start:832 stop:1323 length:492 start_codon:yes stop_codon:yes gene_type:complete
MKKLLFLLFFIPLASFGQEDIERFKVYETTNIYTSLLLDTATGKIWQLQIGINDTDRIETILSDTKFASTLEDITEEWNEDMKKWEENYNSKADSIVSAESKSLWKPFSLEKRLEWSSIAKNGRFKLYPTGNMYNFIMVDVIDGRTWQVQWNNSENKRLVIAF